MPGQQTQFRLNIDSTLLARLKQKAAEQGCSTSSLMCAHLQAAMAGDCLDHELTRQQVNPTTRVLLDCAVGQRTLRLAMQDLSLDTVDDLRRLMHAARLPWPGLNASDIQQMTEQVLTLSHSATRTVDSAQVLVLLEHAALLSLLNHPKGLNSLCQLPWTLAISDASFNAIARSQEGRAQLIMDWMRQHQLTVITTQAYAVANGLATLEDSALEIAEQWCSQGPDSHCLRLVDELTAVESLQTKTKAKDCERLHTLVIQALEPWLGSAVQPDQGKRSPSNVVAATHGGQALMNQGAARLKTWIDQRALPAIKQTWLQTSKQLTELQRNVMKWRATRSGILRTKPETELVNDFSTRLKQKGQ